MSKIVDPSRKPLTDEQLDQAGKALIYKYPASIQTNADPPINGQLYANISFLLFPPDKIFMTKFGKPVYGYVKVRGVWPDSNSAYADARRIVKEVDSVYRIGNGARVGMWIPISEDTDFIAEQIDVEDESTAVQLRSEAQIEKQKQIRQEKKNEEERLKELQENDIHDTPESVEFYAMRRVTEAKLTDTIAEFENKIKEMKEKRFKVWREMRYLERLNPSHITEWVDVYNVERRAVGIPDYVMSETQYAEYDAYHPTDEDLADLNLDKIRGYKAIDKSKKPLPRTAATSSKTSVRNDGGGKA